MIPLGLGLHAYRTSCQLTSDQRAATPAIRTDGVKDDVDTLRGSTRLDDRTKL